MTQAELASSNRLRHQSLIAVEKGRYPTSFEMEFRIIRALKVALDDSFQLPHVRPIEEALRTHTP